MNFIKKMKELIQRAKYRLSREYCYNEMESRGIAAMSCCSGLAGGDFNSGHLQYECVDCPYFVDVTKK